MSTIPTWHSCLILPLTCDTNLGDLSATISQAHRPVALRFRKTIFNYRQLALHWLPWKEPAPLSPHRYIHLWPSFSETGNLDLFLHNLFFEIEPSRPWSSGDLWEPKQPKRQLRLLAKHRPFWSAVKMQGQATSPPGASCKASVSTQVSAAVGKCRNKTQDPQIPSPTFSRHLGSVPQAILHRWHARPAIWMPANPLWGGRRRKRSKENAVGGDAQKKYHVNSQKCREECKGRHLQQLVSLTASAEKSPVGS